MSAQTDALRSEVLSLPEVDRAQLAVEHLDSLDDRPVETDPAELERLWADETARRASQIDSGEVTTDSWDDVLAKVDRARRTR
jgi:putative addiction module component (TIGR02574 family)